jgi:streptomycin 6-kinase
MTATTPQVPADVLNGVRKRWPDRVDLWADRVETELRELCDRYSATPCRVMNARYGFVVAVTTLHERLVMRASPDPDGPVQAKVAAALADLGVSPAVHEIIETDTGTWMVLDEVRPGTPLPHVDPTNVTLDALIAPLIAIAGHPAPVPDMPSIFDWLHNRLHDDHLADLPAGAAVAPADERRNALRILDELTDDARPGLCHADPSPWNYLASGTDRWTLIDPRGVSGEVNYDLAVLRLKIASRYPMKSYLSRLVEVLRLDHSRIRAWITVACAARV